MATRPIPNDEKQALIQRVGADLNEQHGKQKFYSPKQIGQSLKRLDERVDIHCWAYCFFATPIDFDAHHEALGEACDYAAMKAELLLAFTAGDSESWFDIDLSWLDWPDIDLSDIFDFLDFS